MGVSHVGRDNDDENSRLSELKKELQEFTQLTDRHRTAYLVPLRQRRIEGYKFRRQHPIGEFIVDFVCLELKLIVEIDGGQHSQCTNQDSQRTIHLMNRGYRVLRFWNNDVLINLE